MSTPTTVHALCLDLARESTSRVERWALLALAARSESVAADREANERRFLTTEARRLDKRERAKMDRSMLLSSITGMAAHWFVARVATPKPVSTAPAN